MASVDQTIALAGIFQSLSLIHSIAHHGMLDMEYYEQSTKSILELDADSTLAVFGGDIDNLKLGFTELIDGLQSVANSPKAIEITRHLINIMVLEKKLSANKELLQQLKSGIERASSQLEHFAIIDENIAQMLARTYKQTISNISPKIMINGESKHLNNIHQADKIRTLLLAAIRATVLWRQKGGVRWRLIFDRNTIIKIANQLLIKGYP